MRSGNLFSRYQAVSRWSGLVAAVAMVLLTLAASAQMVGSEKEKNIGTLNRHKIRQKRKWMRRHMKTL